MHHIWNADLIDNRKIILLQCTRKVIILNLRHTLTFHSHLERLCYQLAISID